MVGVVHGWIKGIEVVILRYVYRYKYKNKR